jgi:hypothetical protein
MKLALSRTVIAILMGCFLIFGSHGSYAQTCQIENQVAVPITFSRFTPTIPVVINGQTVQFSIDTGSETSVVTPETASRFGLPQDPKHRTRLVGDGGTTIIPHVFLDFDIGGVHFTKVSVPVSEMPVFPANDKNNYGPDVNICRHDWYRYFVRF